MALGDILGQLMQQGLGGATQPGDRLRTTTGNMQQGGGGLESILGQIQGALGRAGIDTSALNQGAGGFADRAGDFMRDKQVGNLSGAQIGGIGALAGAVLGRGLGGAARGGIMAVLGTLAISALKNAQARQAGGVAAPATDGEVAAVTGPDAEKLILVAMISAAKADGQIDQDEMQKVIGRISQDSVTPDEKQFVLEQMAAPLDIGALVSQVSGPEQAAQVYAASLVAINADTDAEKAYLADLARQLGLDSATVAELHRMTGVA